MGSSLSQQLCCVPCERCREQEAADTEPSETKPILQSPRDTRTFLDTQPSTPALKVPKQSSKELLQDQQPSADALEENGEPCSAAEGWEAAWNPMDFFVLPADEEAEGEDEGLSQQEKVGEAEEKKKPAAGGVPVGDTALGAGEKEGEAEEERKPAGGGAPVGDTALGAGEEQAGSEGAPRAGGALQEGDTPSLVELSREAEAETEPPADTLGALVGRGLSLCAVEGTDRAEAAETSPQRAQRAELSCLVEAMSLLTLQSPSEVVAREVAELCSSSAASWQPLCPQWGCLQLPRHVLELLREDRRGTVPPAQAVGSLSCAGCAGLSDTLQQPQREALRELGQEGSWGCPPGPEAELEDGIMELPEEPADFALVQQEAELPQVHPSLPQVLGSRGEIEAEKVEA